jgi:large subunit ribosomal protein L29
MKAREILRKDEKELKELLEQKRDKLRQLRFDLVANKIKNHREIRQIKKDIARILTILKQNKHA